MVAAADQILERLELLDSRPTQSRWARSAPWLMAGVVVVGFALMFVGMSRGAHEIVALTATIEKQRTEIATQTVTIDALNTSVGALTEQLVASQNRANNINYQGMKREFERVLQVPDLGERLRGLREFSEMNKYYRDLAHVLTQNLFADLDASIAGTEVSKAAADAAAAAKAAAADAARQAATEAAAAKAKADEEARLAAAEVARRRAELDRILRDERVCTNARCTSWIIR